jgi:hypothetical protein
MGQVGQCRSRPKRGRWGGTTVSQQTRLYGARDSDDRHVEGGVNPSPPDVGTLTIADKKFLKIKYLEGIIRHKPYLSS